MLWDEPKIFFLERRYFFSIILSEFLKNRVAPQFVCDSCDEDARKALKRCKLYKSFKLSYWGWMDFHTGLVVLPEEKISTNASGHSAAQVFERGLFHKQKKSLFRKERAV